MLGLRGVPARRSSTRRSRACRCARSWRRPATCKKKGIDARPEIMIPLVGHVNELHAVQSRAGAGRRSRSQKEKGVKVPLQVRHDDRDAARRADRRRDRRGRRVLLLRHQRPDPDDLRLLAATTPRASSSASTSSTKILPAQPFQTIDRDGVGTPDADRRRGGPRDPARTSRSASAASTAATRTRSTSATSSASTTSRARPFRVPVARLAAAQAAISEGSTTK